MSSSIQPPTAVLQAVSQLVGILASLPSEERKRAITAAMVLLGDDQVLAQGANSNPPGQNSNNQTLGGQSDQGISAKAAHWMSKNAVTMEQLENVFAIDADGIEVIAARLPGKSKKDQTVQAYVISGLKNFLSNGETGFSDEEARAICQKVGCYDGTNHSKYFKGLGNFVGGTRGSGLKLTNPGLSEAAKIVKDLNG